MVKHEIHLPLDVNGVSWYHISGGNFEEIHTELAYMEKNIDKICNTAYDIEYKILSNLEIKSKATKAKHAQRGDTCEDHNT